MGIFDKDYLEKMSHADLYRMRAQLGADQGLLAPYEHRAFAREATAENPLMALPIATAIPFYQLQKILGLSGARSAPSMDQMVQAYKGIWEGLQK